MAASLISCPWMTTFGNNGGRPRGMAAFVLAMIAIVLAHGWLVRAGVGDMCDDAMISARYARNMAMGDGLRYNLAAEGARPVEGYSNFLWTMGLAVGFKFQLHPRVTSALMGAVSSMVAVLVLGLWVRRRTGSSLAGVAAALALAVNRPFISWSIQGLETPLFALLGMAAVAMADPDRPRPWEHALAALACLCRPDGIVVAAAVIAVQLISPSRDIKRLLTSAGAFLVLPMAVYVGWKLHHFGAAVPNPYYAKTGLGLPGLAVGIRYALGFVASISALPMAVLFFIGLANFAPRFARAGRGRPLIAPAFLIAGYSAFAIWVGGDFMPGHRFFMHLLPVIIGAGVIGTHLLVIGAAPPSRLKRSWSVLVAVLAVGAFLLMSRPSMPGSVGEFEDNWRKDQADWYGRVSSWLARNAKTTDVIACGDVGYIGYVSGVDRILDTSGLVDPYLARRPGAASMDADPEYLVSARPDFIVVMVHIFPAGHVIGHTAMDRALLSDLNHLSGYALAAELPGWREVARSEDDGLVRESRIGFWVYKKQ